MIKTISENFFFRIFSNQKFIILKYIHLWDSSKNIFYCKIYFIYWSLDEKIIVKNNVYYIHWFILSIYVAASDFINMLSFFLHLQQFLLLLRNLKYLIFINLLEFWKINYLFSIYICIHRYIYIWVVRIYFIL